MIFNARKELGLPKTITLGFQHMFAMFGATVLVSVLTGLSVSATLLFAGLGTLLFHLLTGGKVPAFLGSSFAFLAGYWAIAPNGEPELLPYACAGVAVAGLLYVVMAGLFKAFGAKKVMRFFPPIVTGPIIIAIGLTLSSSAISNCSSNIWIALIAIVVVIAANIWGKGMIKIVPILLGVVASYGVAAATGQCDFSAIKDAAWFGLPILWKNTTFALFFGQVDVSLLITSIVTIAPIAIATIVEHIGDICAISSTCGKDFVKDPGLHRTLLGDGLATTMAALFGAPSNTTYGENTGVLTLSQVADPLVVRIAAYLAILVSFSPKFAALINCMPVATIGGISLILYGMISAVGVRNIVENKVDFTISRNVIIAALILVLSIGIKYGTPTGALVVTVGGINVALSGLAVASIVGIVLNAVLPNKNEFDLNTAVDFKV